MQYLSIYQSIYLCMCLLIYLHVCMYIYIYKLKWYVCMYIYIYINIYVCLMCVLYIAAGDQSISSAGWSCFGHLQQTRWHCDHSAHPTIRPGPAIEKTCTWRKYGTNGPMGALLESIYWVSNSVTMPTTKHVPESLQTTARWGFTNKTQHSTGFTSTGINNAFHSAPAYSVGSPAILVSLDHDGPVKLIPTRRPLKTEEKTPGVGRKETYLWYLCR